MHYSINTDASMYDEISISPNSFDNSFEDTEKTYIHELTYPAQDTCLMDSIGSLFSKIKNTSDNPNRYDTMDLRIEANCFSLGDSYRFVSKSSKDYTDFV